MSLAGALASGLLVAAAFDLISEGTKSNAVLTLLGVIAGVTLISIFRKRMDKCKTHDVGHLTKAGLLKAIVIIGVMTIHSFAEGIAVGLSFGVHDLSFGFMISLVIALHNVPEGLAIGLVLILQGVKIYRLSVTKHRREILV